MVFIGFPLHCIKRECFFKFKLDSIFIRTSWRCFKTNCIVICFTCFLYSLTWIKNIKNLVLIGWRYLMLGSHCRAICCKRHDWPIVADRRNFLNRPKFYYDQHDCHDWQRATDCYRSWEIAAHPNTAWCWSCPRLIPITTIYKHDKMRSVALF